MSDEPTPIAPIPLARSVPRLLALPGLLLVLAGVAGTGGAVLGGTAAIALLVGGGVVALAAAVLAMVLLSVRLEVDVASLRIRWIGGERRYALVRGPVTRVALRGRNASRLRARIGVMGWAIGPARLREGEAIEVVKLAAAGTVILVPTDRGRLAVAATAEEELLTALAAAARVQQRLEEVSGRAPVEPLRVARPSEETYAAFPVQRDESTAEPAPPPTPAVQPQPRLLTGIERALLEERLASERAAAAQQLRVVEPPVVSAAPPPPEQAPPSGATAPQPRPVPATSVTEPAPPTAHPRRQRVRAHWHRPGWLTLGTESLTWSAATVALSPVIGAGVIGAWVMVTGGVATETIGGRTLLLGLLLAGPVATFAVLAAGARWPRLVSLVALSAMCSLALLGRVVVG